MAAGEGRAPTGAIPVIQAQERPERHGHDTAGKVSFELYATEIRQHHDRQRCYLYDRMRRESRAR